MTDKNKLLDLRKKIFMMSYVGGISHLASSYSVLEILYTLYIKGGINVRPEEPNWDDRDRLILSKGHAGLALYSVMQLAGFFKEEELWTFLKKDTRLGGEPNIYDLPGVEASTGSLGHGLAIGTGMALANKLNNKKSRVVVILGDGECQEGSIWESVMFAAGKKLDNLTVILDCNGIQKMGQITDIVGFSKWDSIWSSFGWNVINVDGHDVEALEAAEKCPNESGKPTIIIAHTIKGKGVSIMENNPIWHFKLPNRKERKVFIEELNISEEEMDSCKTHI